MPFVQTETLAAATTQVCKLRMRNYKNQGQKHGPMKYIPTLALWQFRTRQQTACMIMRKHSKFEASIAIQSNNVESPEQTPKHAETVGNGRRCTPLILRSTLKQWDLFRTRLMATRPGVGRGQRNLPLLLGPNLRVECQTATFILTKS